MGKKSEALGAGDRAFGMGSSKTALSSSDGTLFEQRHRKSMVRRGVVLSWYVMRHGPGDTAVIGCTVLSNDTTTYDLVQ